MEIAKYGHNETYRRPNPVSKHPGMTDYLTNDRRISQLVRSKIDEMGYSKILRVGDNLHIQLTRKSLDKPHESKMFAQCTKMNNSEQVLLQINTIMCSEYTVEQCKVIILEHELIHAKMFLDPTERQHANCGHTGLRLELVTMRNNFHNNPELTIYSNGNHMVNDFKGQMRFAEYLYDRHCDLTGHYPPSNTTC